MKRATKIALGTAALPAAYVAGLITVVFAALAEYELRHAIARHRPRRPWNA